MSDAMVINPRFFTPGNVDILMISLDDFIEFNMYPTEDRIKASTHIIIGSVTIDGDLEDNLVFIAENLQLSVWSPHQEARKFLNGNKMPYRSISTGDILRQGNRAFFLENNGFTSITSGILSGMNFKRI
jgi:hypothetical protein